MKSQTLIGHKSRCFDVKCIPNESMLALSSSEDGTAILWNINLKSPLFKFKHSTEFEVLRSAFLSDSNADKIATCGADGNVLCWQRRATKCLHGKLAEKVSYRVVCTLPHRDAQIYACESLRKDSYHITAADDSVYFWSLPAFMADDSSSRVIEPIRSIQINQLSSSAKGFGGAKRNPDNKVFVFDCKVIRSVESGSEVSLVVACSDCSLRLFNVEDLALSRVISLRHLYFSFVEEDVPVITSVSTTVYQNIASATLSSGEIVFFDVNSLLVISHHRVHSRTCFGVVVVQSSVSSSSPQNCSFRCLTWSSDCTVKCWTYTLTGRDAQLVLLREHSFPSFPVYSCELLWDESVVCGGGDNGSSSFLGCPLHILPNSFCAADGGDPAVRIEPIE